jgi:hypothetical protein
MAFVVLLVRLARKRAKAIEGDRNDTPERR